MNPTSKSLLLPLTFPTITLSTGQSYRSQPLDVLQASCSAAEPSTLVSWGLSRSFREQDEVNDADNGPHTKGVVMGCKDGSFYVFHAASSQPTPSGSDDQISEPNEQPPTSAFHLFQHSRPLSRSTSPSLQPPFQLAARSRVVSGLSTESVEAPKTFVDFDDETDKLKDMLKGRAAREKSAQSLVPPSSDKTLSIIPSVSVVETSAMPRKRKKGPRSLLSATNSPTFTPMQLSTPTSPGFPPVLIQSENVQQLKLVCHTVPSRGGPDNPIVGMSLIDDNRLLVALHSQG